MFCLREGFNGLPFFWLVEKEGAAFQSHDPFRVVTKTGFLTNWKQRPPKATKGHKNTTSPFENFPKSPFLMRLMLGSSGIGFKYSSLFTIKKGEMYQSTIIPKHILYTSYIKYYRITVYNWETDLTYKEGGWGFGATLLWSCAWFKIIATSEF